jgi:TRAP-type mannitol/chloroaromatic compound transport system permease large subunit
MEASMAWFYASGCCSPCWPRCSSLLHELVEAGTGKLDESRWSASPNPKTCRTASPRPSNLCHRSGSQVNRAMTITIFLGALLGAMALGVPIAFSLLACGAALMWHLNMFDAADPGAEHHRRRQQLPAAGRPFFMLAGEIMNAGGLSRRIVNFAMTLVGHVRGGLGYVGIMAAIIMAALSGSAVADAAALAALLLPMMNRAGYDTARSAGLLSAASIIAPIIPPSIGFVVFGVAANVSISKLFMAGIVPGLMLGAGLWITWWWLVRKETSSRAARHPRRGLARSATPPSRWCCRSSWWWA